MKTKIKASVKNEKSIISVTKSSQRELSPLNGLSSNQKSKLKEFMIGPSASFMKNSFRDDDDTESIKNSSAQVKSTTAQRTLTPRNVKSLNLTSSNSYDLAKKSKISIKEITKLDSCSKNSKSINEINNNNLKSSSFVKAKEQSTKSTIYETIKNSSNSSKVKSKMLESSKIEIKRDQDKYYSTVKKAARSFSNAPMISNIGKERIVPIKTLSTNTGYSSAVKPLSSKLVNNLNKPKTPVKSPNNYVSSLKLSSGKSQITKVMNNSPINNKKDLPSPNKLKKFDLNLSSKTAQLQNQTVNQSENSNKSLNNDSTTHINQNTQLLNKFTKRDIIQEQFEEEARSEYLSSAVNKSNNNAFDYDNQMNEFNSKRNAKNNNQFKPKLIYEQFYAKMNQIVTKSINFYETKIKVLQSQVDKLQEKLKDENSKSQLQINLKPKQQSQSQIFIKIDYVPPNFESIRRNTKFEYETTKLLAEINDYNPSNQNSKLSKNDHKTETYDTLQNQQKAIVNHNQDEIQLDEYKTREFKNLNFDTHDFKKEMQELNSINSNKIENNDIGNDVLDTFKTAKEEISVFKFEMPLEDQDIEKNNNDIMLNALDDVNDNQAAIDIHGFPIKTQPKDHEIQNGPDRFLNIVQSNNLQETLSQGYSGFLTAHLNNKLQFLFGKKKNKIVSEGLYIDMIMKSFSPVKINYSKSSFRPTCFSCCLQESCQLWVYAGMNDLEDKMYNCPKTLQNLLIAEPDKITVNDFVLEVDKDICNRMQASMIHQNAKALQVVGGDQEYSPMVKINLTESKIKVLQHTESQQRRDPVALKMSAMQFLYGFGQYIEGGRMNQHSDLQVYNILKDRDATQQINFENKFKSNHILQTSTANSIILFGGKGQYMKINKNKRLFVNEFESAEQEVKFKTDVFQINDLIQQSDSDNFQTFQIQDGE